MVAFAKFAPYKADQNVIDQMYSFIDDQIIGQLVATNYRDDDFDKSGDHGFDYDFCFLARDEYDRLVIYADGDIENEDPTLAGEVVCVCSHTPIDVLAMREAYYDLPYRNRLLLLMRASHEHAQQAGFDFALLRAPFDDADLSVLKSICRQSGASYFAL